MRLSIGMIVKNEERTLRDCLNGIKPILEHVDSQLIIADTGSTDNTIAIAKEFTDNVYEIEWTNDFSAARNTTLDRAEGEWYMYIDADEIFQDVSELIGFFNSGEYKRYESARHKRCENSSKVIYEPVRLFKRHPDTRFFSKIHEIIPDKKPQKRLNSMSMHMDARELSQWEKKKKDERNVSLLLEMHKENPSDTRIILHLVNECFCSERFAEATEFIDIGVKLFDKSSNDIIYHYLATTNVLCYYRMGLYKKTAEAARDYLRTTKRALSFIITVNLTEGEALSKLENFDDADKAYKEALKQLKKYERGELDDEDVIEGLSFVKFSTIKHLLATAIATHHLRTGRFAQAFNVAQEYGISIYEAVSTHITENYERGLFDKVKTLYEYSLKTFGIESNEYEDIVFEIEKAIPNEKIKYKLSHVLLSKQPDDTDYIRLQRLRHNNLEGEELDYFINSDKSFPTIYGDVIVAALRNGSNFSKFAERMNINNIEWFIKQLLNLNDHIPITDLLNEGSWYHTCNSLKTLQIVYMLFEASLNDHLFELYILTYNNYLSRVYRDTVYCEKEIHALPQRHGFVYYATMALACKDTGNLGGFVSCLRKALKYDNSMSDIVATLVKELDKTSLSPQEELDREIASVKKAIISLIRSGQADQARQVLAGYEQLMPSDPDINKIKNMLNK